uniref:Uncharacterized protein n=1 Tax=Anguilla anguilla TaxID=7936 RepID=A0A0E9Y0B8_ANGAN
MCHLFGLRLTEHLWHLHYMPHPFFPQGRAAYSELLPL